MSAILERYRVPIVGVLGILLAAVGVVIYLRRPAAPPIQILEPSPSPLGTDYVEVAVYVSGAVLEPGVYYLPPDGRVQDALEAAGGPTANADLDRVNLALRLHDEDQIYVPEVGEENLPSTSPGGSGEGLININTASAHELEELPGIGPALAQSIVDYREAQGSFGSIEEIMDVQGIGPGIFQDIEELITVR
jgi:competence protein ComEA